MSSAIPTREDDLDSDLLTEAGFLLFNVEASLARASIIGILDMDGLVLYIAEMVGPQPYFCPTGHGIVRNTRVAIEGHSREYIALKLFALRLSPQ